MCCATSLGRLQPAAVHLLHAALIAQHHKCLSSKRLGFKAVLQSFFHGLRDMQWCCIRIPSPFGNG